MKYLKLLGSCFCLFIFGVFAHPALAVTDYDLESTTRIDGNTPNGALLEDLDFYGGSTTRIGDLDDDGVDDLLIGAYGDEVDGTNARGSAYIHFMNADKTIKSIVQITHGTEINESTNATLSLELYDFYGTGTAALGDLDGDGVEDIAVSGGGLGADDDGGIYIHYLNTDGSIKDSALIDRNTPNGPSLDVGGGGFADELANVGDINGDGVVDLMTEASSEDGAGYQRGSAYIMMLNTDGTLDSTFRIGDGTPNGPTIVDDMSFGSGIGSIGDLDGNGVPDVVVGANEYVSDVTETGAAYVVFMDETGGTVSVLGYTELTPSSVTALSELNDSDLYGAAVSGVDDLNDDGVRDLLVGAFRRGVGGRVFVHYMDTDGSVKETYEIKETTTNGPTTLMSFANYGSSVTNLGDWDGDGQGDFIVGSYGYDSTGNLSGAFFMHDSAAPATPPGGGGGSQGGCPPGLLCGTPPPGFVEIEETVCRVDSPNGGEVIEAGGSYEIKWTTAGQGMDNVNIAYSLDAGASWVYEQYGVDDTGSFDWNVVEQTSDQALIKIVCREAGGGTLGTDVSDEVFTISDDPSMDESDDEAATDDPSSEDESDDQSSEEEGGDETDEGTDEAMGDGEEHDTGEGEETTDEGVSEEEQADDVEDVTLPAGLERGDLFKIANDFNPETRFDTTVYYIDQDGVRHAFPHEKIFMTWYNDYEDVVIIDENVLNQIPQGNDVLTRPGTKFVKIPSSPDVYYVAPGNILRHIADEALAQRMIGEGWQSNVIDIQPVVLRQYSFGTPITHNMLDETWVEGMLVETEDGDMWYVGDEERRRVTTNGLDANRFYEQFLFDNTEDAWSNLPTGSPVTDQEDKLSLPDYAIAVDATRVEATVQR